MQCRHGTACQQHRKSASRVAERNCPIAKQWPVARPYCRNHLGEKLIVWARARPPISTRRCHISQAMLIVNADDLGRSKAETDAAMACYAKDRITSTSAMVFMTDSERASELAS